LSMPARAVPGIDIPLNVRLMGRGGDVDASFPLHVTVTDPNGQRNKEYGRRLLARGGVAKSGIEFATNDLRGQWTIAVRDAMTGLAATTTIELRDR
jgi:hypothetical protein